ncbi:dihydroorotate dehydrogenase-like protein [Bacteroidota bacterium]
MADLSTTYLGIQLKNPIIIGSCDLTASIDNIVNLEKNGAGAIVLKSIFEEEILLEADDKLKKAKENKLIYSQLSETLDYIDVHLKEKRVGKYLQLIKEAKGKTLIPIIASINCITDSEWTDYAIRIQEAGADALELNISLHPNELEETEFEKTLLKIIMKVSSKVSIPISIKISNSFTNLARTIIELSNTGIAGLVMFNRFYSPDIDITNLTISSENILSSPNEYQNSLRWIGLMSEKVNCNLAASTGIHNGNIIIKQLLAGADAVQLVSAIKINGFEYLTQLIDEIEKWMQEQNFSSIQQFKGKLSYKNAMNPAAYERMQFMKYYSKIN